MTGIVFGIVDFTFLIWYVIFSTFFLHWLCKRHAEFPIKIIAPFYIFHTLISLMYCWLSFIVSADSTTYFQGALSPAVPGALLVSSNFIRAILRVFITYFHLGYVSCFLIFNFLGIIGILLFYWVVKRNIQHPKTLKILNFSLFLPGLSYWTCAIGKDALIMTAIGAITYGFSDSKNIRLVTGISGLILAFMVRPHIYLILVAALFLAFQFSRSRSVAALGSKVVLMGLLMVSAYLSYPFIVKFVGLGEVSSVAISEFVESRESKNISNSSIDFSNYSVPEKYFAYLFRPLFFDARNGMMMVASTENIILLLFVLSTLPAFRLFFSLFRESFGFRFQVIALIIFINIFPLTNSNLGIAVRQKYMILPTLFFLCIVLKDRHLLSKSPELPC